MKIGDRSQVASQQVPVIVRQDQHLASFYLDGLEIGTLAALGQLGRRAPCHIIERSPVGSALPFRTDAQTV
jgi:hypothetical protein